MTRDEAIKIRMDIYSGSEDWRREMSERDVDSYVALNMLKLDEPKSIRDKLVDMLGRKDWTASDVDEFRGCIFAAGLKIVEK